MKKVLVGLGILLVLMVASLWVFPMFFKGKLNAIIKSEANKRLNARVNYTDFDLTLIRTFPDLEFQLDQFSVTGLGAFDGDTLIGLERLGLRLDLMTVIKGEKIKIKGVSLTRANIHALVTRSGKANWDIMKPTPPGETEESKPFALQIGKYKIEDARLVYADTSGNQFFSMDHFFFEGSGDIESDLYTFDFTTRAEAINLSNGGVPLLRHAALKAGMKIDADNQNRKYTISENELELNNFKLKSGGFVQLLTDSTYQMDLQLSSANNEFKSLLSMIPAIYQKDFASVKTNGTLSFKLSLKGLMAGNNYPALQLNLEVNRGSFQYPSLPVGVKNIAFKLEVQKPQGDLDLMVVNVPSFHAEALSDRLDAQFKLKQPMSDPDLQAEVKANLDLGNVQKYYPIEQGKNLNGKLLADLMFSGKSSDVTNKNFEKVQASGNLNITQMTYRGAEVPLPLFIASMVLQFNPAKVELKELKASIGRSDFAANGDLSNFIPYALGKGVLSGAIDIQGNTLDVNQLLGKEAAPKNQQATDTTKSSYPEVPGNIQFSGSAGFGTVFFDKLEMKNVGGQIAVASREIQLKSLKAELLGGSGIINGRYATPEGSAPVIEFSYDIQKFDFQQTFKQVELSSKIAPVIAHLNGNFSTDMRLTGTLNPDMSINYNSLNGEGKFSIPQAQIKNLKVLEQIASVAKIPALQNLEIKDAYTVLKFKDGRVETEPTEIKAGPVQIGLHGWNGFDQKIDYDVRFDLPTSMMGSAAQGLLAKIPSIPGVPISMPEKFSLFFKVKGPFQKPEVKLSKVTTGGASSVKESLNAALEQQKQRAIDEAKKQAAALEQKAREEAEKRKAELEQKARAEADKLKADAEKKAKEAAEKAKREAEKQLKNTFKWPK